MSDDNLFERLTDLSIGTGSKTPLAAIARIEELWANINLKADFIDATMNQLAASDQRIEELEAKLLAFLLFLDENYSHALGYVARQKMQQLYAELEEEKDE